MSSSEQTTLGRWLRDIPTVYKVIAVVVSTFTAGVIFAVTFISFLNLPSAVEANARQIKEQQASIEAMQATQEEWAPLISDVPEIMSAMAGLERQIRQANCFQEADKREIAWTPCLRPPYRLTGSTSE